MLKRKAMNDLIEWKKNHENNCLIVIGARQVGKTFLIKEFAKENYKKVIYLNFIERQNLNTIFDDELDAISIIKKMSLMIDDFEIIDRDTIIILDEIQVCERAITALKFLALEKNFDVVASSSLLGLSYKRVDSFPVGYIERLELNSLDFEEFLWANGMNEDTILNLKEYFDNLKKVPDAIHERMMSLFKEYIIVGGMPKVVSNYVINHNFNNVLKLQKNIINDYKDDIIKYAGVTDKSRIRACFDSIPRHLSKDYKKFRYNLVEQNGTANKLYGSLEWLYDAGIINFCYNLKLPESPFEGNVIDDIFKVYMKDTGLLVSMLEEGSALEIYNGNLGIYKGAIYENIIADIFNKNGKKLYYFEYNSTLEIDFFIKYDGVATAVEVKSADNTKSKSLNSITKNLNVKKCIRLSSKNIGYNFDINVYYIPLYMAIFL